MENKRKEVTIETVRKSIAQWKKSNCMRLESRMEARFSTLSANSVTGYRSLAVRRVELTGYFVHCGHPFSYDCSLKLSFLFVWILLLSRTTSLQSWGRFLWTTRYVIAFNSVTFRDSQPTDCSWQPDSWRSPGVRHKNTARNRTAHRGLCSSSSWRPDMLMNSHDCMMTRSGLLTRQTPFCSVVTSHTKVHRCLISPNENYSPSMTKTWRPTRRTRGRRTHLGGACWLRGVPVTPAAAGFSRHLPA